MKGKTIISLYGPYLLLILIILYLYTSHKEPETVVVTKPVVEKVVEKVVQVVEIPKRITPSDIAIVTFYAPQTNKEHRVHFEDSLYTDFSQYTMSNIADYCHHNGFAFFFRNNHLVDTDKQAAYWGKMDVMKHYLDKGYEWVVWTDIDVLFFSNSSLYDNWLSKATPNQHIALVTECLGNKGVSGTVRSGFFAVRNSAQGYDFLNAWKASFATFGKNFNPEQEALENFVTIQPWKEYAMISSHDGIHTYPNCLHYDANPISVHFPAGSKGDIKNYYKDMVKNQGRPNDFEIKFPIKPDQ